MAVFPLFVAPPPKGCGLVIGSVFFFPLHAIPFFGDRLFSHRLFFRAVYPSGPCFLVPLFRKNFVISRNPGILIGLYLSSRLSKPVSSFVFWPRALPLRPSALVSPTFVSYFP